MLCTKFRIPSNFPGGSDSKESAHNAGNGLGRYPGEGNGYPPQYSCLKKSMDNGAWGWATVQGLKESDMTEQLSMHTIYAITLT